jgi:hypothetical protein
MAITGRIEDTYEIYMTYAFGLKFGKLTASSKIMEPFPVLFHLRACAEQQRNRKAYIRKRSMAIAGRGKLKTVNICQKSC